MKKFHPRRWLDDHVAEILGGASRVLILRVIAAGLAFFLNIVLARTFGAEVVGLYQIALSLALMATVFARVGMDGSVSRLVATNAETGNWAVVRGVYDLSLRIALAGSIVAALVLFVLAPWLASVVFAKAELLGVIRAISFAIVPLTMAFVVSASLRALRNYIGFALSHGHQSALMPAIMLLGLLFIGPASGANGIVVIFTVASFATFFLAVVVMQRTSGELKEQKTGSYSGAKLMAASSPLLLASVLEMASIQLIPVLVGIWRPTAEVGIFSMAWKTAVVAASVLLAISVSAGPKFAALYARGDLDTLGFTARKAARWALYISSPVFALLLLAPQWVMGWFGAEFRAGAIYLVPIALAQLVNVGTGAVHTLLIMCGKERLAGAINSAGALAMILFTVLLTPVWGAMGAALGVSIGIIGRNLAAVIAARVTLGIRTI